MLASELIITGFVQKTWKVLEFCHGIFQDWKVQEKASGPGKFWKSV